MKAYLIIVIVCLFFVAPSSFSAADELVVIKNATIYTMGSEGIIENGSIIIKGSRIVSVGKEIELPMGVAYIDAKGGSVTPGLFNSTTHIGIDEVSAIKQTNDFKTSLTNVTASLKVADAFNPNSVIIPQNRIHGLTKALVVPESGSSLIAGQAAIVDLSGSYDSVIDDYAALVVNFGEKGKHLAGGSRAAAIRLFKNLLEESREYADNKQQYLQGQSRDFELSKSDLEAMQAVIFQKKLVIIRVHRAADILQTLKLVKHEKLNAVLAGVEEGWMVKQQLADSQIPVIIEPILNLPSRYETLGSRLDNAALLHSTGVKLLFTGMGWQNTHNAYLVRQSAGNAVANGLDKSAAIAAITKNPSEVFGVENSGSIEVGGIADLVLWQGDPLEVTSEAVLVFVNGKKIEMVSRSTRLRDRYYKKLIKSK